MNEQNDEAFERLEREKREPKVLSAAGLDLNPQQDNSLRFQGETTSQDKAHLKGEDDGFDTSIAPRSDDHGVKERIQRYKQSQTRDSAQIPISAISARIVPFPKFPRIGIGMIWTTLATCFVFLLFNTFSPQSTTTHLLVHLPMQLFWTSCLFRLVQIADRLNETETKPATIALISITAFLFAPMFPGPSFVSRFLDPTFLIWIAAQCAAPWIVGSKIDKADPKGRSKQRINLTLMGNWYLLFGIWIPAVVNSDWLCNFFWLLSQMAWLVTANQTLQTKISKLSLPEEEDPESKDLKEKAFIAGGDIELRYRAFAAIERWLAQRFSVQGMKQNVKQVLMWVCGPAMVVIGVLLTNFIFYGFLHNASSGPTGGDPTASGGSVVQMYMLGFICAIMSILTIGLLMFRSNPTHLQLSPLGLRFAWKHKFTRPKTGLRHSWSEISHIRVERPKGQTSTLHDTLVFEHANGIPLKIKLAALDSFEDKEWILKAIKAWAPQVSRDAAVLQSLQPPADYSYTELWLQALSAPPQRERLKPLVPGVKLKQAKYLVKKSIGVGGQGQAYLAADALSGQTLVLKEFILPVFVDISIRKSALEQFENEARILRQLEHPQIVKLLDYFVEDHRAYLVLEHIDGASLRTLVESQGALPEPQVRALAEQMVKILAYLHNLAPPVVHRDFTPDNLILNVDGTLKLIDFNVAQQQESTTSGTVVGKHAYLPPEQFRGMPTSQSDIYAMGATLYYLLTGGDPEPISVAHPKKTNASVSTAMDKLVAKATAMNLRDRYERIEKLQEDL